MNRAAERNRCCSHYHRLGWAPAEIFAVLTSAPEFISFCSSNYYGFYWFTQLQRTQLPSLIKITPGISSTPRQCSKASVWLLHFSQTHHVFIESRSLGTRAELTGSLAPRRIQKSIVIHFKISFLCRGQAISGVSGCFPRASGGQFQFFHFPPHDIFLYYPQERARVTFHHELNFSKPAFVYFASVCDS